MTEVTHDSIRGERESMAKVIERARDLEAYNTEVARRHARAISRDSDLARDDALAPGMRPSDVALESIKIAVEAAGVWSRSVLVSGPTPHADYSLLRAMMESLATAVWILGPEDSRQRVTRIFRLAALESKEFDQYVKRVDRMSDGMHPEHRAGLRHTHQSEDTRLRSLAIAAGLDTKFIFARETITRTAILEQAAEYIPQLHPVDAWGLWSLCSGLAHGQRMYATGLSNRSEVAFFDETVETTLSASGSVLIRFVDAVWWMLESAVELYNIRASAADQA